MKPILFGVMAACVNWLVTGCGDLGEDQRSSEQLGAEPPSISGNANHPPGTTSVALAAACGDGILDAGEACDDGNLEDHDGCSAGCTLELVAQFSFTGAAGDEVTRLADIADPDLASVPAVSRGPAITPSVAANAFSASAWTTGAVADPDDFYTVTVAPAAGAAMNLLALQLDERRSATGIRSWSVRSSLDGFAADLAVFAVPDDILTRTQTVVLPVELRGLTTAVELRLFGFQAETAVGTWRIDNVTLIGEVEPTCGDGDLDPGEQCDDGNTDDGDGCTATCAFELVTQFSFPGAAGTEVTFAADLTDPELAATPVISRGVGVAPSPAVDAFSASGWTTSPGIDPDDFYSFTVTPLPGATMKLVGLQLDERRSATGIHSWSLRSSLDGFASDLALVTVPDDILIRTQIIPLPPELGSLTTAVEFRLFAFAAEAAGGTWRVDNVLLLGEIEPACGNSTLDPGEQCDDGNRTARDGCSATCARELVTQFSFTAAAGDEVTFAAELADPGLALAPVMSRGAGVLPSVGANAFSSAAWTTSAVLDPDDYYSFTVEPTAGTTLDLIGLQLDERRSATGIRSASVRSSLDGFTSDLAVFAIPDDILIRTQAFSLPAAFQGLASPVEFRFFGFQAEATGGTWRIDNVTLIGLTSSP